MTVTCERDTVAISERPLTRDEIITKRAENGEDLTAIGRDYNVSRERVRQIVAALTTKSNDEIRAARARHRAATREEREADKIAAIRTAADQNPDATISTLASITGEDTTTVREALDWTERERRADQQTYPSLPDDEVLAEIRRVAALPGGEPLTGTFYDAHRTGGVSHARLLQRFKTWTAACEAANVTPRGPNPGRVYTRNWSDEDMVGWVWAYLTATENPSYVRFENWLRTQDGAPSAQTVRNTIGPWVEMKRRAIQAHASSAA